MSPMNYDDDSENVRCPRCNTPVPFAPTGAYISFCIRCLAFLLPSEFTPENLDALKKQKV